MDDFQLSFHRGRGNSTAAGERHNDCYENWTNSFHATKCAFEALADKIAKNEKWGQKNAVRR